MATDRIEELLRTLNELGGEMSAISAMYFTELILIVKLNNACSSHNIAIQGPCIEEYIVLG